jgi:CBS domain-containing protein
MTQVADVMTRGVRTLSPSDTLQAAAQAMDELNIGSIPVCDNERVVGMVTDRDITVRGVAQGVPGNTPLSAVMSRQVETCYDDDSLEALTSKMSASQIRRVPVLDRQQHLVGVVSLGDLAIRSDLDQAGEALADISEPSEPDRSGASAASGAAAGGSATGKPSRSHG